MRVRFRIALFRNGRRLSKKDLLSEKDPLLVGMRYILEFKYLEATKWLLIAEDCWEKFVLLGLANTALGQEDQGREFLSQADAFRRKTDVQIFIEFPEEGTRKEVTGAWR
ncbi:MAG: hypothetical protein Q9N26_01825 [Aquificota bacterium]|nr:hypothetical protein [Aquificota bacterium]